MLWTEMLYNQVDTPLKSKFDMEDEENENRLVNIDDKIKNKMQEKEEY